MFNRISVARAVCAVTILLGLGGRADAQGFDFTVFLGRAFPIYDERLTLRPPNPSVPGVDIGVVGSPLIEADGGPVFGGALAFEFGILGIEGRLDATEVGFDNHRRPVQPARDPAAIRGPHREHYGCRWEIDADRIPLLSVNARLRTPGPVGLVLSGGLSYLSDVTVTGSIPLSLEYRASPRSPVSTRN